MTNPHPILTSAEAKKFLTRDDLEDLNRTIEKRGVRAALNESNSPALYVRGKLVSLFDVLELLGTL